MNRPTDRDAAFEAKLAALAPAAPSADLRGRVAEALAPAPAARSTPSARPAIRPTTARRLADRLLWACGGAAVGAIAASVAFVLPPGLAPRSLAPRSVALGSPAPAATVPAATVPEVQPPVEVAEESVAWADAGVQFIDDRTPARVFRRVAVERHRPVGGVEYHVPREDVILMPVALQ
ncbi:MAG: hypothetical protein ACKOSQ_03865 [Planctomycetaceae bacterium]